jgi:hypothetical protein
VVGGGALTGCGSDSLGCEDRSAGADSTGGGGGDTGHSGGAGWHVGGEAGTFSNGEGGDSVGEAVKEAVGRASERKGEGGENESGEARQDGGESRNSPSPSTSRNNSTSLRRFRVLFAGGVDTSGDGGVGASQAGAATAEAVAHGGGRIIRAATSGGGCTYTPSTAATTAAAPHNSGISRGCRWKTARDGDDLHSSFVAKNHSCFESTCLASFIQRQKFSGGDYRLRLEAGWHTLTTSNYARPRGSGWDS